MLSKPVHKPDQIRLIKECRESGLSDYQWCKQNNIKPGTFYNWISKLRKLGYTFPESQATTQVKATKQEVVKLDLVEMPRQEVIPKIEQNACVLPPVAEPAVGAEINLGNITLRLYNGADELLIQNTLKCIGGLLCDR